MFLAGTTHSFIEIIIYCYVVQKYTLLGLTYSQIKLFLVFTDITLSNDTPTT